MYNNPMMVTQDGIEIRSSHDNKAVQLLSTYACASPTTDVEWWDKKINKNIDIKSSNIL